MASLREVLEAVLTVRRLNPSPMLEKCLVSTFGGVRGRVRRVTRWKNGAMAPRWAAAAGLRAEKSFRKILGCEAIWMHKAALDRQEPTTEEDVA